MPKELPKASEVWEGDVSFFSIDTNLIQSAGYDFSAGLLHQLPEKLPAAMQLQLSEVVVQEIVNHKMEPVFSSIGQLDSAIRDIERTCAIDTSNVANEVRKLEIVAEAKKRFRGIVESYAAKCHGKILPIDGENLASEIFDRYFQSIPPFAEGKKKAEFPDAAILITLERYAKEKKTKGIIASADKGAKNFADASEHIYCVQSLEALANLFVATDAHAAKIWERIDEALSNEESVLRSSIGTEIENHILESSWTVDEIYCSSVASVDGYIYESTLQDYEIRLADSEIWQPEDKPGVWIVDLSISATVEIGVDVTFYAWDYIDNEQVTIGCEVFPFNRKIRFKTYLTCGGITEENDPEEWITSMDTARADYKINVGEVEPDFGDAPSYDD